MKKIKVLLEMRPALEGFAGIPQEVRLLFKGLCTLDSVELEGLLQTSHRRLAKGMQKGLFQRKRLHPAKEIKRYSNVIISIGEKLEGTIFEESFAWIEKKIESYIIQAKGLMWLDTIRLSSFRSSQFEDFVWRTLFSKTISASDFLLVTKKNYRICSTPWNTFHQVGLRSRNFSMDPKYPKIDTTDFDIFIGQTPYPSNMSRKTKIVIRYHDAIPLFYPHTIPEKAKHQATHFYALTNNVRNGAWFCCVSETTRLDLLKIFPEVENRAITIHNMLPDQYFPDAAESFYLIPGIIRSNLYEKSGFTPKFFSNTEKERFYTRKIPEEEFKYLLIVSTIEPRKNHLRALSAWENIKGELDPMLKIIVVGTLGWDNATITDRFVPWIERGELFMLNSVSSPDLRILYKNAAATICPSLAEGFDFSGVESMRCGGITIASDIPVHQEIYKDAAEYFNPYSTASLVGAIKKVLYSSESSELQELMRRRGDEVSSIYLPKNILPKWESFLAKLVVTKLNN